MERLRNKLQCTIRSEKNILLVAELDSTLKIDKILSLLICPLYKAQGKGELPLKLSEGGLVCGENIYPISKDGIANLKLPFDQDEATSYDDILPDFKMGTPSVESVLNINALVGADVRGKDVLLAGVGGGTDIDWILSLEPKSLVCLDYSPFATTFATQYQQDNIIFVIGDICDLAFKSQSFDLIISQGIIHHTRSPELAFASQVSCLKAGGILSIGNLYSKNLHNHYVSLFRHKYRLDEAPREKAKAFIRLNARIYNFLVKVGLARLHRRFHFPGILHYASTENRGFLYHYNNATDFYMPTYRHLTSPDEVNYWSKRLGVIFQRSPKGYRIQKPE